MLYFSLTVPSSGEKCLPYIEGALFLTMGFDPDKGTVSLNDGILN